MPVKREIIAIDDNYYLSSAPTAEDLGSLVMHLNNREVSDHLLRVPFPYTHNEAERYIKNAEERTKEFGRCMNWQLRNSSHQLIGSITLHNQYGKGSHRDEIGYWLAKPYWGKGIMAKALIAFSNHVFEYYGLVRLEATIFHFNTASMKVVEKCGFNYEGTLKKAYFKDGKYIDGKLYSLVR